MKNEFKLKKCLKCGAIISVLKDCTCNQCGITCCGEPMIELIPNSVDASVEKHVPIYEIKDDVLEVKVNHVMEENHYIEWICFQTENEEKFVYLHPNEEANAIFKNVITGTLYAYCNQHGLWKTEIGKDK